MRLLVYPLRISESFVESSPYIYIICLWQGQRRQAPASAKAFSNAIEKSNFYGPSKTLSITANDGKSSVKLIQQQLQECAFKT